MSYVIKYNQRFGYSIHLWKARKVYTAGYTLFDVYVTLYKLKLMNQDVFERKAFQYVNKKFNVKKGIKNG